jgi:hypothetical protein
VTNCRAIAVSWLAIALFGAVALQAFPLAAASDCGPSGAAASLVQRATGFTNIPIDPAATGPGATAAGLCGPAAAELQKANSTLGDRTFTSVKILVGEAESGDGGEFVETFLSGLGPDARNGTVEIDGRTVQAFWTAAGDGMAYATGPTVVVGYVVRSDSIAAGLDPASTQESAKEAFARIIAAANGTPLPANAIPRSTPASYPLARGRFSTPDDPGWTYFKTDEVKGAIPEHCGIAPGGAVAGCDAVPDDAPSGMNQTVVDDSGPARYIRSDTTTFTRDVDALTQGHRLQSGPAVCWRGYQGTVRCEIGEHGFTTNFVNATLE